MSPKNLIKIAHPQLKISKDNLISVRRWGNEQTDRHTRNLKLFGTSVQTSKECLKKILEWCLILNWSYHDVSLVSERYLIKNQIYWTVYLTVDTHTKIWTKLELVYRYPRNVSRKFEKASSSKTGDIHCSHNFSKEVRQWTDWPTYKKS